jgi:hypothetical protein
VIWCIVEAALRLRTTSFVIDGEAVVLGPDGISDFASRGRWRGYAGRNPENPEALACQAAETVRRWRSLQSPQLALPMSSLLDPQANGGTASPIMHLE